MVGPATSNSTIDGTRKQPGWVMAATLAFALAVAALDVSLSVDVAIGVAYVALIWIALGATARWIVLANAAMACLLIFIGFLLTNPETATEVELANRVLAVFAVCGTAAIAYTRRHKTTDVATLIRSPSGLVWETDETLHLTRFAPPREETATATTSAVLGKTLWQLAGADPNEDRCWGELRQRCVSKGRFKDFQYCLRDGQGRVVHHRLSGQPHFDSGGRFQGYSGTAVDVTDEVTAAKWATPAEQQLISAIDSLPHGLGLYDADWKLVLTNRAYRSLHRLDPKDLEGPLDRPDFVRLIAAAGAIPESIGRQKDWVEERLQQSRKREVPFEQRYIDGRWMLIDEYPTENEGLVTFHMDITNLKKTEQALRESEQRLSAIVSALDFTRDGISIEEPDGRITYANRAALASAGLETLEEIGDRRWEDLQAQNKFRGYAQDRENVRQQVEETGYWSGRVRWLGVDGKVRDYEQRSAPTPDGALINVSTDITEQMRVEAALREREERLKTTVDALDSAGFGLLMYSPDLSILEANRTAIRIAGYRRLEDLRGHRLRDLIGPVEQNYLEQTQRWRDSLDRTGFAQVEVDWLQHSSKERVEVVVTSVRVKDGRILSILSDVTAQRRAEREQKRLERDLQQSQKMEALGRLAGGTAHEINNLLQPILIYSKLVQNRQTDQELRDYLDRTIDAARKAKEIVRDVLLFSRKGPSNLEAHDVSALLSDAVQFVGDLMVERVELIQKDPKRPAMALLDRTEFIQVILNLTQNAFDALDPGGTLVTISSEIVSLRDSQASELSLEHGDYLRISVRDDGVGMSEEVMEHLFEPFFTTKPPGKGTGLGLAVVYGIVKGWQGQIVPFSEPGEGSEFLVYIPLVD